MAGKKEPPPFLFCFLKISHLNTTLQFTSFYFYSILERQMQPPTLRRTLHPVHVPHSSSASFLRRTYEGRDPGWGRGSPQTGEATGQPPQRPADLLTRPAHQLACQGPAWELCQMLQYTLMKDRAQRALLKDRRLAAHHFKMRKEHEHYKRTWTLRNTNGCVYHPAWGKF